MVNRVSGPPNERPHGESTQPVDLAHGARRREPRTVSSLVAMPASFPPPPTPLTTFVGRTTLVANVAAMLRRDDVRLLTLTGPGGVGKTRLALRVAEELADAFADGVAFVELAPIRDPDLVIPSMAQTLGVRSRGEVPAIESLGSLLRDQDLLLLLDNLEQVSEAGPHLIELMQLAPRLTLLATSRNPLRVSGEHVCAVPPLSLAEEDKGD